MERDLWLKSRESQRKGNIKKHTPHSKAKYIQLGETFFIVASRINTKNDNYSHTSRRFKYMARFLDLTRKLLFQSSCFSIDKMAASHSYLQAGTIKRTTAGKVLKISTIVNGHTVIVSHGKTK